MPRMNQSMILDVPSHTDTRDVNAVKRLTTAYLKLLFPHVESIDDMDEFKLFCFDEAYKQRLISGLL